MCIAALSDIVKRFGRVRALDHVDIEVRQGEILGLLGPNGAGKTTAIRVLTGLMPADSGAVTLFGKRQRPGEIEIKRRIGLVTQEVTVFDDLSGRENLSFFGGLYGMTGTELRRCVRETLEFAGLMEHAERRAATYSGGMRRRLNIACALLHRPEFLIMDEPTVGIDAQSRAHILQSVRTLRDTGTTILYTSHYMEEVATLATRVVIMDQGRVIADGTVKDLIRRIRYEERVIVGVEHATDQLRGDLQRIPGVKEVEQDDGTLTVVSEAGAENLDRVIRTAQLAGGILTVRTEEPTLEDVYLTLTGRSLRDGDPG